MQRRVFLFAAGAFLALAGPAAAHAMLVRAIPAVGADVRDAPTELRLRFSERVERALCSITLADAAGHALGLGALALAPDGFTLIAPIRSGLGPGFYRVHWRAVSVDTHVTSGDFSFRVTP